MPPFQPFHLGSLSINPRRLEINREGEIRSIEPLAMRVLLCLVEAEGKVVSREDVIQSVWPDGYAGDGSLSRAIWSLRDALGDDAKNPKYIETIPRIGYCLREEVRKVGCPTEESDLLAARDKEVVRLRKSVRNLRIAVATLCLAVLGTAAGWQISSQDLPRSYQHRLKVMRPDGSVDSLSVTSSSPVAVNTSWFNEKTRKDN